MANETSGVFRDPAGHSMPLSASSPEAFRILVTRKLAAGWSVIPESPTVAPLHDESALAIPEPLPPPPYEAISIGPGAFDGGLTVEVAKPKRAKRTTETTEE